MTFIETERVATKISRDFFLELAKQGRIKTEDLISFCQAASVRLDQLETSMRGSAPPLRERTPCQCANCQGLNGWFASCLGYTP